MVVISKNNFSPFRITFKTEKTVKVLKNLHSHSNCKSNELPNLLSHLHIRYKNDFWISMRDWLGPKIEIFIPCKMQRKTFLKIQVNAKKITL